MPIPFIIVHISLHPRPQITYKSNSFSTFTTTIYKRFIEQYSHECLCGILYLPVPVFEVDRPVVLHITNVSEQHS